MRGQLLCRVRPLKIDLLAGKTERRGVRRRETAHESAADKASGADHDRALRQGRGVVEMVKHVSDPLKVAGAGRPSV